MDNSQIETLSVSQLNDYIKSLIDSDSYLNRINLKGEISNFKYHSTGHLYFSLKDSKSVIKAVMFKAYASKLTFMPEDGMKVIASGRISAFPRDGTYQIYVDSMSREGLGDLYVRYQELLEKLRKEGLLDEAHKKPVPKIPSKVGIVTSPTGAAVQDMINVMNRRFPYAELTVYPSLVQGADAPPQLIAGINYFNRVYPVDVIIIGRGGGSIEDLWAFNSEDLAYAIYGSKIPVISAVGHQTDFTISDFVADKRAPTPSAAAEIAVPETSELKQKILNVIAFEAKSIDKLLERYRERVNLLSSSKYLTDPERIIEDRTNEVMFLSEKLLSRMSDKVSSDKIRLERLSAAVKALDPRGVLSRGYSISYDENGNIIKSTDDISPGDSIRVAVSDGFIIGEVKETEKPEEKHE